MTAMTLELLSDHVCQLAEDHRVEVHCMEGCWQVAYPTLRRIHIRPIRELFDYLSALHEIGHVVLCHDPGQSRAWKELLAWEWAERQAILWDKFAVAECLRLWEIPITHKSLWVHYLL